jgi:hypothetical protein
MKLLKKISVLVIVGLIAPIIQIAYLTGVNHGTETVRLVTLMSPEELQEYFNTKGHDLEVDGIIGRRTMGAWREEVAHRDSLKWFDPNSYRFARLEYLD